jgi:hypothetical protein
MAEPESNFVTATAALHLAAACRASAFDFISLAPPQNFVHIHVMVRSKGALAVSKRADYDHRRNARKVLDYKKQSLQPKNLPSFSTSGVYFVSCHILLSTHLTTVNFFLVLPAVFSPKMMVRGIVVFASPRVFTDDSIVCIMLNSHRCCQCMARIGPCVSGRMFEPFVPV